MATAALISAGEYLNTAFEHDAEFVDVRFEERPVGERDHGLLQRKLLLLLSTPAAEQYFLCIPELRIQTLPSRFRVPDLSLIRTDAPEEQVVTTPPLLCIEILSPEDTMQRTLARVRELLGMGVPEVWVFDPASRTVQVCAGSSRTERSEGMLLVPESPVAVSIADVFAAIVPESSKLRPSGQ